MEKVDSRTRLLRTATATAAALLTVLSAAGCSFIEKQTADAYSITYRVTVEGDEVNKISAVEYGEAPSRGEDSSSVDAGEVGTTNDLDDPRRASWDTTALVTATQDAWITATPPAGASASCSILIDGEREIDSATAPPGEPVECRATTPAFGD
jgi:hypothetical protein